MTTKTDAWMPLWIGAYLADTQHLSRDEHGGYLLLIMAYWRGAAPLPDDDKCLAAIVKAGLREWKALRPALAEFFEVSDGLWRHKRIDAELASAAAKRRKARGKAEAAAQARWGDAPGNAPSIAPSIASSTPQAMHEQCPTPTPSPDKAIVGSSAHASSAVELAIELRRRGVNVTPANPLLVRWLEEGYAPRQIHDALELARLSKPEPARVPAKYLDTVLRAPQARSAQPKTAQPRRARPKERSIHDERAETIAGLTGTRAKAKREPITISHECPGNE